MKKKKCCKPSFCNIPSTKRVKSLIPQGYLGFILYEFTPLPELFSSFFHSPLLTLNSPLLPL